MNNKINIKVTLLIIIGVFISHLCFYKSADASDDWALTLYRAKLTLATMTDTLNFNAEYEDSYLMALALSKKVSSFKKYIDIEIEGQIVKHNGGQDHWEYNALPIVRWLLFRGIHMSIQALQQEAGCHMQRKSRH